MRFYKFCPFIGFFFRKLFLFSETFIYSSQFVLKKFVWLTFMQLWFCSIKFIWPVAVFQLIEWPQLQPNFACYIFLRWCDIFSLCINYFAWVSLFFCWLGLATLGGEMVDMRYSKSRGGWSFPKGRAWKFIFWFFPFRRDSLTWELYTKKKCLIVMSLVNNLSSPCWHAKRLIWLLCLSYKRWSNNFLWLWSQSWNGRVAQYAFLTLQFLVCIFVHDLVCISVFIPLITYTHVFYRGIFTHTDSVTMFGLSSYKMLRSRVRKARKLLSLLR